MDNTALYSIQKKIVEVINDNTDLEVSGGFDEVDQSEQYPLIQVGEPIENRFDTFDRKGKDVIFQIHIWSKYQGYKEGYEILDKLNELLDYQDIDIENFDTVYIRADEVNAVRTNREFRQIIVNYRVIVQNE